MQISDPNAFVFIYAPGTVLSSRFNSLLQFRPGIKFGLDLRLLIIVKTVNETILKRIGIIMLDRGESVSVAESVTAGLLQFSFSNIPDAAKFFQGGITAYNLGQKSRHLFIEPLHGQEVNCVSQQVANEMCLACETIFSSKWGIAATGYASPTPESGNTVFAYFAISYNGSLKVQSKLDSSQSEPSLVQWDYCEKILERFFNLIRK
jgi:nicotinamide-nucleotide amidase